MGLEFAALIVIGAVIGAVTTSLHYQHKIAVLSESLRRSNAVSRVAEHIALRKSAMDQWRAHPNAPGCVIDPRNDCVWPINEDEPN